MRIELRYFASVREAIGKHAETIDLPDGIETVQQVLDHLSADPVYARAFSDKAKLRCAINMETANFNATLQRGDELALFPPMTGGQPLSVSVQADTINVAAELARFEQSGAGAIASFTGLVRAQDQDDDAPLTALTLEHYPGMTEKALADIADKAQQKWPLSGVRIIHRYGRMLPGEIIVLVIAASRHRDAAFDAVRFIMDVLKTDAPFWKQEERGSATKWVEAKASDDTARAKWDS